MSTQEYKIKQQVNYNNSGEEMDPTEDNSGTIGNNCGKTDFDMINYDPNGKYPVGTAQCFYSTKNCKGDVYNGICSAHWGIYGLQFQSVSSPLSPNVLIQPVSTKTLNSSMKIAPLLGMLAPGQNQIHLSHDDATIQKECEYMLNLGMKDTRSSQLTNKLSVYKQAYNRYIQQNISQIKERVVSLIFTPEYKHVKKSKVGNALYNEALRMARENDTDSETQPITILVPLNYFENIYDILVIMAYWPSQCAVSENQSDVVSVIPNVYIINGWLVGGFGFGVPAFTGGNCVDKMSISEHHTIENRTREQLLRKALPVVYPLVLEYKAPLPGTLMVIRPSVSLVNKLEIETDIIPAGGYVPSMPECNTNYNW